MAACVSTRPRYATPFDYIPAMEELSSAVNAELHNPFRPGSLSDGQLLAAAVDQKPELQQAFRKTQLLITNLNGNAIIILVSPTNNRVAWFEDATWTLKVDKFHFQSNPPSPARFTIPFP